MSLTTDLKDPVKARMEGSPKPGNLKPGLDRFSFATATTPNCAQASTEAERISTKALQRKPKHVGGRCARS